MSYLTCNRKKSRHKVHISVCEQCKGIACPDYRNFVQSTLFPLDIQSEASRTTFRPIADKPRSTPVLKKQEQLLLWPIMGVSP